MPLKVTSDNNITSVGGVSLLGVPDGSGAIPTIGGGPTGSITWGTATTSGFTSPIIKNSNHYASIMIGTVGTGGGTWSLQGSTDGVNFTVIKGLLIRNGAIVGSQSAFIPVQATPSHYIFPVGGFTSLNIVSGGVTVPVFFTYGLLSASAFIPIFNPRITSEGAVAQTEPITTFAISNDTAGPQSALAVTICAQTQGPGNNSGAMLRTPSIFKTAAATNTGNTAAWTPAAGKKFRLMRYQLELTENATLAVAAVLTIKFQDNVTDFGFQHDIFVAAAAGAVSGEAWRSGWIDLGNGYLSLVANNVLNFNISGAANLTAGQFRVNVCGTEE